MNVKRYKFTTLYDNSWMEESSYGEYVKFEDYEKLYVALEQIHNFPDNESIWTDSCIDAAWDMVEISGLAIGVLDESDFPED